MPIRSGSQSPRAPGDTNLTAPPPATGGAARVPLRFNARQTTEAETAESEAMEAYYRLSLWLMGRTNADKIQHRRVTGGNRKAPPARCAPLAEVHEEDVDRGSTYTGGPAPKAVAKRRESDRMHGQSVYGSFNVFSLWKRLRKPRPTPPEFPRNPEEGFDDDAADLAK